MNETVAIPAGKPSETGRGEREAVERNIVRTRSGKIKIKGRNRSQTAITALCLVLLGITAVGADRAEALAKSYAAAEKISFDGVHYRKDIGKISE